MEEARANVDVDKHERGFRKIAWAFLKVLCCGRTEKKSLLLQIALLISTYFSLRIHQIVGTNGVLNIDSKLRLQLYCPPPRAKKQPKTIEAFEWWRMYPRNKYPSTLYVTVKGIKLPEHVNHFITYYSTVDFSYMLKWKLFDSAGGPQYSVHDGAAGGERKHLL